MVQVIQKVKNKNLKSLSMKLQLKLKQGPITKNCMYFSSNLHIHPLSPFITNFASLFYYDRVWYKDFG